MKKEVACKTKLEEMKATVAQRDVIGEDAPEEKEDKEHKTLKTPALGSLFKSPSNKTNVGSKDTDQPLGEPNPTQGLLSQI